MRQLLPLFAFLFVGFASAAKKHSVHSPVQGYSQPITNGGNYGAAVTPSGSVGVAAPPPAGYSYSQPMTMAASEYYQPMDNGYNAYGRQAPYYEPIPQASGHYPIKRGHGWGHGHGGHELSSIFWAIPLILIPLLLCWPWFVYAASHHHHPIVYAAPGWKRSSDGSAPTLKEAVEELSEKILPKLKD